VLVFDRLVLDVDNLERSLRFYTEVLDFQVVGNGAWSGSRTAILQLGAFHLLLLEQPREPGMDYQLPKSGPVIGLSEVKLEARATALQRAGVTIVAPLRPSASGSLSLLISDPDGYLIMLQEPAAIPAG
jgi:catechol 2,3-dioxygenase-like lactoylglutathione lyase family enzyme